VIPAIPIATTPPPKGTLAPLTIPTVPQRVAMPQLDTGLLPEWLRAYQEEENNILQADAEHRAAQ
jgi:hypothetical protein